MAARDTPHTAATSLNGMRALAEMISIICLSSLSIFSILLKQFVNKSSYSFSICQIIREKNVINHQKDEKDDI
jgi:hypothetical protein